MVGMIHGTTVTVYKPYQVGTDRFNNVVYGMTGADVSDVLIAPGATEFLEASRPEGVKVAYTLHFPKTFADSLEGCSVELHPPYSGTYKVIGNPQPYMYENTPTRWNMPVEIEAAHG
jgi:hypothetical protein